MDEPQRRRESFDTVAELYNQYRPGYPAEVVDAIVGAAGLKAGDRVLEIGCGTGQLTGPLLDWGAHVHAVELGVHLAAIARAKFQGKPNCIIDTAAFEEWPIPAEPFDVVVSATAFHWIDAAVRANKCWEALGPGGALVALYPHHIEGGSVQYFQDSQTYYLKWGLSTHPDWRLPTADEVPRMYEDIDKHPGFAVERRFLEIVRHLTREQYVGQLRTDSLILTLAPQAREGFLSDIAALIDSRCGGSIDRRFRYEIVIARKE